MSGPNRRTFLKLVSSGAMAAALPASIERALAVPAHRRTGTIKDVEHIVVLMQENRSFDHYFGTLRGVRGFADPRAVKLPSGQSVWHQPNGGGTLLPFRPDVDNVGLTFLPDPPHRWNDTHAAWNWGNFDQWVPNKGVACMTYHTRKDLPYHFALADAFTVCDAYYCSLMGGTDPNRFYLWSGWTGNDGKGGGPVVFNDELGYSWHTFPERLQDAGITWKVYQDIGDGLNADGGNWWGWTADPFIGNYGDNALLYFLQYQNAKPGEPLANFAKTGTNIKAQGRNPLKLLEDFRADVRNGKLPQVSWITAPEAYTEHPNWPADWGAWYVSQVIDALVANPEVWSKTVLLVNFDEEGGYFDHMVPPTPPMNDAQGASTVDTVDEIFPGDPHHPRNPPAAPYGLGMRVPMLVVSPWSKGGWVNSEVFDHTSIIRFIEARFADEHPGLVETNITPWRRAVVGDLTSAFDFRNPDARPVKLPSTAAYMPTNLVGQPDYVPVPPANQLLPKQEPGVRPARALPYALHAHGVADSEQAVFRIDFSNIGKAAAVFQARSGDGKTGPRCYTVEPGKELSGAWAIGAAGYDISVFGPNGFLRAFKGSLGRDAARLDVRAEYEEREAAVEITVTNLNTHKASLRIVDKYTGRHVRKELKPGESVSKRWSLESSFGWYELIVTEETDSRFEYRLAGHVETGEHSISDPSIGGLVIKG